MAVLETHEQHQELIDELIADVSAYNPDVDRDLITRAFRFAAEAHEGQQRRSGEDFVLHPWGAAKRKAREIRSRSTSGLYAETSAISSSMSSWCFS